MKDPKPKKPKKKDMATREALYRAFGPLLVEAVVLLTLDEINLLRAHAGLPVRTEAQLRDAISSRLSSLPLYPWMEDVYGP